MRQAAEREAHEETGLTVETGELLGVYDRLLPDGNGRTLYHYVLIDFLCRLLDGEAKAAADAEDVRWFTQEEIENLALPEDTAEVIRLGFKRVERPEK
jgi:8-oxo-dGTP diphosphatase